MEKPPKETSQEVPTVNLTVPEVLDLVVRYHEWATPDHSIAIKLGLADPTEIYCHIQVLPEVSVSSGKPIIKVWRKSCWNESEEKRIKSKRDSEIRVRAWDKRKLIVQNLARAISKKLNGLDLEASRSIAETIIGSQQTEIAKLYGIEVKFDKEGNVV